MRSTVLARGRALCVCALAAATVAGCTRASSANVTVAGKTLTIYASAPAQTSAPEVSRDVLDAEQLALQQAGAQVGGYTIRLVTLDGSKISDNARAAIQDKSAIAYLGEIPPHGSAASVGITNALDLLQVSPTDTGLELTLSTPAVPIAPSGYYESLSTYGRTFARVVPNTLKEARAQVQEMQALGVRKLYVTDDGGPYGAAIALAVKQAAAKTMSVVQGPASADKFTASGADALFLGANSNAAAASLLRGVATSDPSAMLFAPSALDNSSFAGEFGTTRAKLYVSAPGFLSADLTPAARTYESAFIAAYHHPPAVQAIFGYEAMAAVLSVLKQAGAAANSRSTIVRDFFLIKNRQSALGTYSIDANGDTTLAPFVFSRLTNGTLVPDKFVQVLG